MKKQAGLLLCLAAVVLLAGCASVVLDSNPSGADVYDKTGTELLGTTPFDTFVVHSPKSFVLRKDRYMEEPVSVPFHAAPSMSVDLRAAPVLLQSDPVAAVYPAGTQRTIGRTPLRVRVEGGRTYVLKAEGYYDKEVVVSIDSSDPTSVQLERRPIVTVSSRPADVVVYEEGRRVGTTPFTEEITRERTFEFRKEGHFAETLTLAGAPPYEVSVELRPYPEITVNVSPASASIVRDGRTVATGSTTLTVGEPIQLVARADRYYEKEISLTPDSPVRVQVELDPMPYVTVRSQPEGAQVVHNGRVIGTAPVELLVEQPTTVEVRRDGYQSATQRLTGRDATVTVRLERIPEPEPKPEVKPEEKTPALEPEPKPDAEEEALSWWQRFLRWLGL